MVNTMTNDACLAHMVVDQDFGSVLGEAYSGSLCHKQAIGVSTIFGKDEEHVIATMAYEISHNFGAHVQNIKRFCYINFCFKIYIFLVSNSLKKKLCDS